MVGVREPGEQATAKAGRTGWIWRVWEEFVFTRDLEFWQSNQFPNLSTLLENAKIRATDAMVLSIQISSPLSPAPPQIDGSHYVPKDLIDGIEGLLDDAATGDVRIYVRERKSVIVDEQKIWLHRKRSLFAHSAILKSRSAYFQSMLGSDWAEGEVEDSGAGRRFVIKIDDFDFVTVYWVRFYSELDEID